MHGKGMETFSFSAYWGEAGVGGQTRLCNKWRG